MRLVCAWSLAAAFLAVAQPQPSTQGDRPELAWFFQAASADRRESTQALNQIAAVWKNGYAAMIFDIARQMRPSQSAAVAIDEPALVNDDDPDSRPRGGRSGLNPPPPQDSSIRARLVRFLEQQTGQRFGDDLGALQRWMWTLPYEPHPDYAAFKGLAYQQIDPRMRRFFPPGVSSSIRLDEVDWGGVVVNGIPPLDYPEVVGPREASYLGDNNVVFGIEMNGEARAYPRRILAWHELARDRVGGEELTIVYCTLCGTVIPYRSVTNGQLFRFGTSGLLYRSNKLMFDEDTGSLWSTLEGKPVIGRLVGSGFELRPEAVVTTTWQEWRREHPNTTVLSLDTGFKRDYSEGAAYRQYFGTDQLMFEVSQRDSRLKNKAEVLVMLLRSEADSRQPVAISVDFLRRRPVFHLDVGGFRLLVVTTQRGANRVYRVEGHSFDKVASDGAVLEQGGGRWSVTEEALVSQADPSQRLPRQAAQRAFWFGWYAQFPTTMLVK